MVVEDRKIPSELHRACLDQPQIQEAPFVIVFLGDHRAFENNFEFILQQEMKAGAITTAYANAQ